VDIETLQKVNTDLISTIEETLRIQQDGAETRAGRGAAQENGKRAQAKTAEVNGS